MAIGASLWGLFNQTGEFGSSITKPGKIGCQYGYVNLRWHAGQRRVRQGARHRAAGRATGRTSSWSTCWASASTTRPAASSSPTTTRASIPTSRSSYLNAKNVKYNPNNFINAALAGIGDGHNGGGPIWAIFDSDAVAREKWDPKPPHVDFDAGFFFKADTHRRARGKRSR